MCVCVFVLCVDVRAVYPASDWLLAAVRVRRSAVKSAEPFCARRPERTIKRERERKKKRVVLPRVPERRFNVSHCCSANPCAAVFD